MSTLAHNITRGIATEWDGMYGSAVLSGIVGDAAHQKRGGYHISIEDQSSTNYSVTRPDDKAPPGTWPRNLAAAIDMSMNPSDMALCSGRLWNVWNDKTDPRRVYINAFNGWFNESDVPAKRYDFVTQGISETTSDHKWHVHLEIRRKYVTSPEAAKAILSILRGESKAQYIASLLEEESMFCKKGDVNGQVGVLQIQINEVLTDMGDANLLVVDNDYGPKTADGLMRSGCGNAANNGEVYWVGEYVTLDGKLRAIAAKKAVAEHFATVTHGHVMLPENVHLTIASGEMTAAIAPVTAS